MKKVSKLTEEMDLIQVEISTGDLKKNEISKLKKRYSFLKLCVSYIQSNPTSEFLQNEKKRLSNKIKLINDGYIPNKRFLEQGLYKEEKKEHKDYNKIMGIDKWKEQLKSIVFLIN